MKGRRFLAIVALMALVGCNNNSPTAPSNPAPPPAPTTYTLEASVLDASSGDGLAAAVLRILDGQFAGQTFTAGEDGRISITGGRGNMNIEATHTGHASARGGVGQCPTVGCSSSIVFRLDRTAPWQVVGSGSTVFDMPEDIRRVRIAAVFFGFSANFAVWIGGRPGGLTVNELMGTGWGQVAFEGIFSTQGGQVDVEGGGVTWSLTQVYQ